MYLALLPIDQDEERAAAQADAVLRLPNAADAVEALLLHVSAGYLPVVDVTAEDVLRRNPRFLTRAKSFDTFLVFGSRLLVPDGDLDLSGLEVRTVIDGEVVARNTVANMHFSPRELVAFHSEVMTLRPGDLVSTGTPGAGVIRPGSRVRAEVDRVGAVAADVVR